MRKLRLKRGQERRILEGSLWVFSNQVDDPLREYQPGEIVHLTTRGGRFLGTGYVNPHSLIAFRLLSKEETEIDADFFRRRLEQAKQLRRMILPGEEALREVFSESDGLPGLIVDRYAEILVISIATAGMDRLRDVICEALQTVYQPLGIFERSDLPVRKLEGLEPRSGPIFGAIPTKAIWVKFAGVALPIDVERGQKTGLYLDQRANIESIAPFTRGATVLDAFCYEGAWGLKAAKSGAKSVTFLDSSEWVLGQAMKAARRNRVAEICRPMQANAFDALKKMAKDKKSFDLVILDPPSFIRSRAHFKEGYKGYFDLNRRAAALVNPGGILVTCSCSHHMEEATFFDLIKSVLRQTGREGRLLYRGGQSPDHPILPAMPETEYLHCFALQLS